MLLLVTELPKSILFLCKLCIRPFWLDQWVGAKGGRTPGESDTFGVYGQMTICTILIVHTEYQVPVSGQDGLIV